MIDSAVESRMGRSMGSTPDQVGSPSRKKGPSKVKVGLGVAVASAIFFVGMNVGEDKGRDHAESDAQSASEQLALQEDAFVRLSDGTVPVDAIGRVVVIRALATAEAPNGVNVAQFVPLIAAEGSDIDQLTEMVTRQSDFDNDPGVQTEPIVLPVDMVNPESIAGASPAAEVIPMTVIVNPPTELTPTTVG